MTTRDSIDAWWRSLDSDRRRAVLRVAPGEAVPGDLALDLLMAGVPVPLVSVGWDVDGRVDRGTVFVQPRALTDYLDQVRAGLPVG